MPRGGGLSPAADLIEEQWIDWIVHGSGGTPRLLMSDGGDERVIRAAKRLGANLCHPVLVTEKKSITASLHPVVAGTGVDVISPAELRDSLAGECLAKDNDHFGRSQVAKWLEDPLFLAAGAVASDVADACVSGATRPTSDVLRAGLKVIRPAKNRKTVSSSFLMCMPDGRWFAYGDCAVVPEPDADELAEIAIATAQTYESLVGNEPRVAMLSFSTLGSAEHQTINVIRDAISAVHADVADVNIDGEMQFDAAFVDKVARVKAPRSSVAGDANVFIFPNLAAGNIAYKMTERLGSAGAYGPILQGLAKPFNDVSRGCGDADIFTVALISMVQAIANQ